MTWNIQMIWEKLREKTKLAIWLKVGVLWIGGFLIGRAIYPKVSQWHSGSFNSAWHSAIRVHNSMRNWLLLIWRHLREMNLGISTAFAKLCSFPKRTSNITIPHLHVQIQDFPQKLLNRKVYVIMILAPEMASFHFLEHVLKL